MAFGFFLFAHERFGKKSKIKKFLQIFIFVVNIQIYNYNFNNARNIKNCKSKTVYINQHTAICFAKVSIFETFLNIIEINEAAKLMIVSILAISI